MNLVIDTLTFLKEQPEVYSALKRLISYSFRNRRTTILKNDFKDEIEILKNSGCIFEGSGEAFTIHYEQPKVCQILIELAEESLNMKVPVDITGSFEFIDKFTLDIRNPEPRNYWYGDLESNLERYILIYLNNIHNVDITAFFHAITVEMEEAYPSLRSYSMRYWEAFPYLLDNAEKSFEAIEFSHSQEYARSDALDALSRTGEKNLEKAKKLLDYAKANNGIRLSGVIPSIIVGLFPSDPDKYFQEAIDLFNTNYVEGLFTLTWINYSDEQQINQAFEFITSREMKDIQYLRVVPTFISRLIKNEHALANIKKAGFELLDQYLDIDDDELRSNLVWRLSHINGHDEEKFALLPKVLAWGKPHVLNSYFNHFNSPKNLFELIKDSFIVHGLKTNFELFKRALDGQYRRNTSLFELELLDLLTDNLGIVRFAGFQVLTSKYGGIYDVDLLRLNEIRQLRVIDTLLHLPTHIEGVFPQILKLRLSPFEIVREKLKRSLKDLIWAYDRGLMDLAERYLDKSVREDKELLEDLNHAFAEYEKEKELKKRVKEFSPFENELEYWEQFFRLEQEKNTEMMESAGKQSFFGQNAKNISVIRGSGFNSEINKDIAMMGEMKFSRMIDQRYSVNPESYEWNFKISVFNNNYSTEDEA